MRKTAVLLVALIISTWVVAAPVQAQEAAPTPTPVSARSRSAEKRSETQAKIQEKRTEVRTKVSEVHGRRLKHNFGVYYQRLSNIINRLQSRLTALEDQGKDIAAAEEKLTDAESMLESAKMKGETAVTAFLSEPKEDQREAALAARDVAKEARLEFMAVFSFLKEVVQIMKGL